MDGPDTGPFEHDAHLLVRETHLDAGDDQLSILGPQSLEGTVVAVECLPADRDIERRGVIGE